MVSGGSAVESEAVIKLALMGGASRIFVSRPPSSGVGEYLKRMNSHKIVVLDGDPNSYRSRLHQKIDVIIDLGYLKDIDFLKLALVPKGRLVCVVPRNKSKNLVESVTEMLGQATLIKHPGTSVYDFEEMSKSNYKEVVRDLHYLLDLTQKRRLRPKVDRYIKARDVEIMLEDMAIRPPRGAVICEPWREFVHEPEPVPSIKQRFQEFCSQSLLLES
jgi:NADPH:quinone reductase-like Zn-dependent oxidoreductase